MVQIQIKLAQFHLNELKTCLALVVLLVQEASPRSLLKPSKNATAKAKAKERLWFSFGLLPTSVPTKML